MCMKIALVNKKFTLSGGGAERYAVDLANALIAEGHEVDCYGNILEDLNAKAGKCLVPMFNKPGWLRILSFARNFMKIIQNKKNDYDIVYALTQAFPADLYFMGGGAHEHWLSLRFPNRMINFLKRIITPTHSAQLWLENQLYNKNNCTAIMANSHLIREHSKLYGNVSADRVFVVHNGIDNMRFNITVASKFRESTRNDFNIGEDEFVISYLSHNWPRKGLKTILEAMALIKRRHNSCRIIIGGKGDIDEFTERGLGFGLDERDMIFVGAYSMPEKLYVASDVSILPTMYDPCAGVTVEAMACGVPVITTPENGSHELVKHGESGFVLSSYNAVEELVEYLSILQDKEVRERMGKAAERDVRHRTFKQVVNETIEVMQEIVEMKKRAQK